MAEKYDQMNIDINDNPNSNDKYKQDSDESKTVSIDISKASMDNDEEDFVSPDIDLFNQVASNVNKPLESYTATWHGGDREEHHDFKVDEAYASTKNADKQFMETFGLTSNGIHTTSTYEKANNEHEFAHDDIYSDDYEYTDRMQRREIIGMYKYAKKRIKIRLVFSIIFALFVFAIENITLFVPNPTGFFNIVEYPYIHTTISLVALILCAICAYEQLYHGMKSMFAHDLSPESIAAIALILSIVHSVTTYIFVSSDMYEAGAFSLYNFPTAFILVSTIWFSYVNVVRERYGFSVVSSKDSKFVLEKVYENNAEAEFDTFTTTSNGEFNGEIARVTKTPFVKNYFANTNSTVDMHKFLKYYYILATLIAVVFAIISLFTNHTASQAVTYFVAGVYLLIPFGVLMAYSYPFLIANRNLYEDEVAIIGEEAIEEFGTVDVVAVNDTTAFPPHNVKIRNIKGYNDYDIEKISYLAASGFSVVGGPLAEVFDAVLNNAIPKSKRVKFVCSGRSYLCVHVDSHSVIFADKYGMTAQGIEVGNEREDKTDVSVMYMACDGVLCSKMYLKYEIDDEFIYAAENLNRHGMVVGIRTFDPNISNDLINKLTGFEKSEVRTIKLSSEADAPTPTVRADGQIVSKGLSSSLLKAVPTCRKILKTRKVIKAFKIIASLLGGVYLGFCVFNKASLFVSSFIVACYTAFGILMYLITRAMLPRKK